jgi:hypothetical protein
VRCSLGIDERFAQRICYLAHGFSSAEPLFHLRDFIARVRNSLCRINLQSFPHNPSRNACAWVWALWQNLGDVKKLRAFAVHRKKFSAEWSNPLSIALQYPAIALFITGRNSSILHAIRHEAASASTATVADSAIGETQTNARSGAAVETSSFKE